MAQFTIKVEGADQLRRRFQTIARNGPEAAGRAMREFADVVFDRSQAIVPVDTGALKDSGQVTGPTNIGGTIDVEISYGNEGVDYAVYVHEQLNKRHAPPTQAKYLEHPFLEALGRIDEILGREWESNLE